MRAHTQTQIATKQPAALWSCSEAWFIENILIGYGLVGKQQGKEVKGAR